jgi:hypothetical protein
MSTDFSIRPVGTPVAAPVAQPASLAASNAVATDLPASQSVTAAAASAGSDLPATSGAISHQVTLDRAAATIVYQVIDEKTDTVINQYPDDAVLRRRAYFHALDLTKGAPQRPPATDRTA